MISQVCNNSSHLSAAVYCSLEMLQEAFKRCVAEVMCS